MAKRVAIGIDLGTTNSCAGFFTNSKVDIIYNDQGGRVTPSYVSFTSDEIFVGEAGKEEALVNAENTVFENKRLIGRKFADSGVQSDMKKWPFEVFNDNGAPKIRVQYKEARKEYAPEQISAMILKKMREDAEAAIGEKVQDAVITVPAYFNDSQRQATIDAGKIAGLNVLSIINEPTAAALAYGFEKKVILNQNILVFDYGGGTFDVSIVSISDKNYSVVAVGGDTHLGGGDFDYRLVDYFVDLIKRKHNKDLSENQRALGRLRRACEIAKIRLTKSPTAKVLVDSLFDGKDFKETITRSRFDELCSDLFKKAIGIVKSVIDDSALTKSDIDEVILVGGSSRIPKIQELLSEFFDGKKLNSTINPDEAVAYGAAVKAALASGERTIEEITMADVTPLSLGMAAPKDVMSTFIKRNTRIPTTVTQSNWTTENDYDSRVTIQVYEGERDQASNNHLLGSFDLEIGEEVKKGVPKLTFTFEVDENGILHVSGENRNTGTTQGISITSNKGRLLSDDIQCMMREQNH